MFLAIHLPINYSSHPLPAPDRPEITEKVPVCEIGIGHGEISLHPPRRPPGIAHDVDLIERGHCLLRKDSNTKKPKTEGNLLACPRHEQQLTFSYTF